MNWQTSPTQSIIAPKVSTIQPEAYAAKPNFPACQQGMYVAKPRAPFAPANFTGNQYFHMQYPVQSVYGNGHVSRYPQPLPITAQNQASAYAGHQPYLAAPVSTGQIENQTAQPWNRFPAQRTALTPSPDQLPVYDNSSQALPYNNYYPAVDVTPPKSPTSALLAGQAYGPDTSSSLTPTGQDYAFLDNLLSDSINIMQDL